MKKFLVLLFPRQEGLYDFDYSFVNAYTQQQAYEIIDEGSIVHPEGFVPNCLILITQETIEKLKRMVKEIEKRLEKEELEKNG